MQSDTIRRETPADYSTVENLTREAFWNVYRPGCTEHFVLHQFRERPNFVPELDLVMEAGNPSHDLWPHQHCPGIPGPGLRHYPSSPLHGKGQGDGHGCAGDYGQYRILRQIRVCTREINGHPV